MPHAYFLAFLTVVGRAGAAVPFVRRRWGVRSMRLLAEQAACAPACVLAQRCLPCPQWPVLLAKIGAGTEFLTVKKKSVRN